MLTCTNMLMCTSMLMPQHSRQVTSTLTARVSALCSGSWVDEVAKTAGAVSDFSSVSGTISDLKAAAAKGDLASSKGKFVSVTSALKSWTQAAGIGDQIRGL